MSGHQKDGPIVPRLVVEVQYSQIIQITKSPALVFHNFFLSFPPGKQYLRYGCRRKVDSKMVHKSFCDRLDKHHWIGYCNQKPCPTPMYGQFKPHSKILLQLIDHSKHWNGSNSVSFTKTKLKSDVKVEKSHLELELYVLTDHMNYPVASHWTILY